MQIVFSKRVRKEKKNKVKCLNFLRIKIKYIKEKYSAAYVIVQ